MGMFVMGMVFWACVVYVVPWVTDKVDHWNTGEARIWQHDFNVGHEGGSSHFLTQYYEGNVLVIEILNTTPMTVHTYVASCQFLTPPPVPPIITLEVRDINGDQKPDLLLHVEGISSPIPLYNNGQTFQTDDPTKKG
jgi:hypothetical protein